MRLASPRLLRCAPKPTSNHNDNSTAVIFANVSTVIADAEALHALYGCKGTSGPKCCMCCVNAFNTNTVRKVVENDKTGFAVYHT